MSGDGNEMVTSLKDNIGISPIPEIIDIEQPLTGKKEKKDKK